MWTIDYLTSAWIVGLAAVIVAMVIIAASRLIFQRRGQLEMSFDMFPSQTVDNPVLDLPYHLVPDCQRNRQINKGKAALPHIAEYAADYRESSKNSRGPRRSRPRCSAALRIARPWA
jgi:hypothetical protein